MSMITLDVSACGSEKISINQYTENFDKVKFIIDENVDGLTLALITGIGTRLNIIKDDDTCIERGKDEDSQKTYLIWSPDNTVTNTSGSLRYQIAAYKLNDDGEYSAVWYSDEGRIVVGESMSMSELIKARIKNEPSLLLKMYFKVEALLKKLENSHDTYEFDGMIKINSKPEYSYLPTPCEKYRGRITVLYSKGQDKIYICLGSGVDDDGNVKYKWVNIAQGNSSSGDAPNDPIDPIDSIDPIDPIDPVDPSGDDTTVVTNAAIADIGVADLCKAE